MTYIAAVLAVVMGMLLTAYVWSLRCEPAWRDRDPGADGGGW